MRISKLTMGFVALLGVLLCTSFAARAEDARMADRVLGNSKAPITVYEYASLTCSHCAEFQTKTLPEIRKRYIDTGKVRFVLRDFPLDGMALRASALARCMPAEQYYPFVHILYENMMQWATNKDPEKVLVQYAGMAGLAADTAKACFNDGKLLDALINARTEATKKYDIQATPTFIINDGAKVLTGGLPLEEFSSAFDALLAGKK